VFISYSHVDKKYADDLARRLYRARIQYFRDTESIAPGQKIDKSVYEALNNASHMIVLISPALAKSAWIPYEMGYAQAKGISVVPYLLHENMEVPSFLANYKYIQGH
jgi:nucleoside 2-deoxyribosyltransferase